MKILMFGWEFPPYNSGGLGVACLGLTRALAAQNVKVTFVLPYKVDINPNFVKLVFADPTIDFRDRNRFLSGYMTAEMYQLYRTKMKVPFYSGDLFEEVRRYASLAAAIALSEDFDIIHAHDWLTYGAGLEAKRATGKPLIIHVHATEFDRSGENPDRRIYEIEKEAMGKADGIIAVSNYTKNIIIQKYGIDPAKIEVVWNGIDCEDWPEETSFDNPVMRFKEMGYKLVLFVGRITMQKGPDYFLLAAKKVLEHNSNVIFLMAGAGDMERQIIQQAAYLGISDKVLFPGFLRGEQLNRVYRAADLFVLSSVSEPFGITPLESMMSGTPVLVSNQSGVAEALSHALKVDFWNVDEMANKILSVLANPSLYNTLSQNGQSEVKRFNWARAAQKVIGFYQKFLKRDKSVQQNYQPNAPLQN